LPAIVREMPQPGLVSPVGMSGLPPQCVPLPQKAARGGGKKNKPTTVSVKRSLAI
jgi:hypothetical protein